MGALYSSQPISNYNSNPPSDDGSAVSTNQITWAGNKSKLADPIKTRTDAMDSALVTAFTKTLGGGGITSVSTDYTIQASDQGKLVKATASLALTMGDATAFLAPFCFGFVNLSGTTIAVSGGGGQTIDGNSSFTVAPNAGFLAFTDGSNWNTTGLAGTLIGKQLMAGFIINGTLTQSNSSNAVTWALKTLAGNDPSSTDPVLLCFRNSTLGTGNYVYRTVTAALSIKISSGGTMGATNAVPFRIWAALFDDAGTIKMGVINCLSSGNIYPLGRNLRASSTADDNAGGSTSARVFYTKNGLATVSSKPYLVLGYADYETGLTNAGSWNVDPDHIQLFGPGIPLPGSVVQVAMSSTTTAGTTNNTSALTTLTNSPSCSITPTSAANPVHVSASGSIGDASGGNTVLQTLRGATLVGPAVALVITGTTPCSFDFMDTPASSSSVTYQFQGKVSAGTLSFPAGTVNSIATGVSMVLEELMG